MAGIKTIPLNATTDTVLEHYLPTLVRIRRCVHTHALIPDVESFRARIDDAMTEERKLREADLEASAAMHFTDRDLDDSATFVAANVDLKSLLGTRLFGDMRPRDFRRPLLGGQLEAMTAWPTVLQDSEKEVLRQHVPILAQRVATGQTAADEKKETTRRLADFRTVGTRVRLIEAFNAWRKSLFGKLGDMQHANPALGTGWAESFFLQESADEPTVAELERKIAAAEVDIERWKKQRDELKAHEEATAAARAAAIRKEKQAQLEALQKAKADIEAKAAAIAAELDDSP
ncbi:MAG TPA: hypothetical protein PK156_39435 [Polyangium sp.]|nr:hypothetical protein [Polyangium sp.]